MSELSAGLRARLAALVAEARAAGALEMLRAEFEELAAHAAPELAGGEELPGRFGMIGTSPPMQALYELIERVAPADVPVLVQGETGTGKELVARALHEASPRRNKPLFAVNCAAVPPQLLESELFGHKKGAFTGAVADRPGHFVTADGGTVFLDEIGDMPLAMQAKLLRVLQEGEVRPVGSNRVVHVDVRVVAATNKDLAAMCGSGEFREDLYFRLNVVTLKLPALRERGSDIELLARHFAQLASEEIGKPVEIESDALEALSAHDWPGNVRELENEIRRAAVLSGGRIRRVDLSPRVLAAAPDGAG